MSNVLTTKQKTELKKILPDISREVFVKKAIDSTLKSFKAAVFFDISEKIRSGLTKKGNVPEEVLSEFKD